MRSIERVAAPLKLGGAELMPALLKLGSVFTVASGVHPQCFANRSARAAFAKTTDRWPYWCCDSWSTACLVRMIRGPAIWMLRGPARAVLRRVPVILYYKVIFEEWSVRHLCVQCEMRCWEILEASW